MSGDGEGGVNQGVLKGILQWSLNHSDGTAPARVISEEDRKWFFEALQARAHAAQ